MQWKYGLGLNHKSWWLGMGKRVRLQMRSFDFNFG